VDLDLEVVFLDDYARPRDLQQLVLRDELLRALDERKQHIERPAAERRRGAVDEHLPGGRIQFAAAETVRGLHGANLPQGERV
jgi:hypothetical protein